MGLWYSCETFEDSQWQLKNWDQKLINQMLHCCIILHNIIVAHATAVKEILPEAAIALVAFPANEIDGNNGIRMVVFLLILKVTPVT